MTGDYGMAGSTFDTTKTLLTDLLKEIHTGKLQLPDFQRGWVWDEERIRSLLASVAVSFPIGAVMLLETGSSDMHFKPRTVQGVPPSANLSPDTLILDGQQRLTSLYQTLMRSEPVETVTEQKKKIERYYYFDMQKMVQDEYDDEVAIRSISASRQVLSNFGRDIVLDLSTPELEYQNHFFPVNRIRDAFAWFIGYQEYWNYHSEQTKLFTQFHGKVISRIEQYSLPVIKLSRETPKEAVCLVFEKVNTGGVALTVFELLTASFAAENFQLRDDWEAREKRLKTKYKTLASLQSTDFLQAIALLVTQAKRQKEIEQGLTGDRLPGIGCKRVDILRLTVTDYRDWADKVESGFGEAARFLHSQSIYRDADVPYRTQIVPLAAVFVSLGTKAETAGAQSQLARWYWCGVLGELYGGAVETRFARDLPDLVGYICGAGLEPKTIQDANFDANRLLSLTTRNSAAYKGIHALLMRSPCLDFRTGVQITQSTLFDDSIDIHHIFPQKWCNENQIPPSRSNSIVNKTALAARTNRIIGGQAPSTYLSRLHLDSTLSSGQMDRILLSHGIEPRDLRADSFNSFFAARGYFLIDLIEEAMGKTVARAGADFLSSPERDEYVEDTPDWGEDGQHAESAGDTYLTPVAPAELSAIEPEVAANGNAAAPAMPRAEIEKRFDEALLSIYKRAKDEANYHAGHLLHMLNDLGGLGTARHLLAAERISDGFTELYLRNRLDLTVEAHVIKPDHRVLFSNEEIAIAEKRLRELGYLTA